MEMLESCADPWRTAIALACVAGSFTVGCAKLAGVDDYSVPAESAIHTPREAVLGFLGGGHCAACIEEACADKVDVCRADDGCAKPAACLGQCQIRNQGAGDPACVLSQCAGATLPSNVALIELSVCARLACLEACRIGRSWACAGRYDLPPVPEAPFVISLRIGIFDEPQRFAGAFVRLCDRRSPLPACENSYQLAVGHTDDDGLVPLRVEPSAGVTGLPALPPTYFYLDPTPAVPVAGGVRPATIAHRMEGTTGVRSWADPVFANVLGYGTRSGTVRRLLYGTVMDCRASRLFAAAGLRLEWAHATIKLYWDGDSNEYTVNHTHLSGVFSTIIGDADDPLAQTAIVPAGVQRIDFVDDESDEIRASYDVIVPAEGNLALLLLPPGASRSQAD